jgi:hypothetical protein
MSFENETQPAVRPRPRGQAFGQKPAREDAGAPLVAFHFQMTSTHGGVGFIFTSRQRRLNSAVARATRELPNRPVG